MLGTVDWWVHVRVYFYSFCLCADPSCSEGQVDLGDTHSFTVWRHSELCGVELGSCDEK